MQLVQFSNDARKAKRFTMFVKGIVLGAAIIFAAFLVYSLAGCVVVRDYPQPSATRTPTGTPVVQYPPTPTHTPGPRRVLTSADFHIMVENIESLPFSKTSDDFVIGYFTGDSRIESALIEIHVRGRNPELCQSFEKKKCKDKIGGIVRQTGNLLNDREVYEKNKKKPEHEYEHLYCGSGVNYHDRLAVSNGLWIVRVRNEYIEIETPIGVFYREFLKVPGTIGISEFTPGCPQPLDAKRRTMCWNAQDAVNVAPRVDPKTKTPLPRFTVSLVDVRPVGEQHDRTLCSQGVKVGTERIAPIGVLLGKPFPRLFRVTLEPAPFDVSRPIAIPLAKPADR